MASAPGGFLRLHRPMFDEPLKIIRGNPDKSADLEGLEKPGMDDVVSRGPGDLEDPHNILHFQVFFHFYLRTV